MKKKEVVNLLVVRSAKVDLKEWNRASKTLKKKYNKSMSEFIRECVSNFNEAETKLLE